MLALFVALVVRRRATGIVTMLLCMTMIFADISDSSIYLAEAHYQNRLLPFGDTPDKQYIGEEPHVIEHGAKSSHLHSTRTKSVYASVLWTVHD